MVVLVFCDWPNYYDFESMVRERIDRKDERNEKSDYNQSQMIEQRKDRRKPLDSPEEISLLPNV